MATHKKYVHMPVNRKSHICQTVHRLDIVIQAVNFQQPTPFCHDFAKCSKDLHFHDDDVHCQYDMMPSCQTQYHRVHAQP